MNGMPGYSSAEYDAAEQQRERERHAVISQHIRTTLTSYDSSQNQRPLAQDASPGIGQPAASQTAHLVTPPTVSSPGGVCNDAVEREMKKERERHLLIARHIGEQLRVADGSAQQHAFIGITSPDPHHVRGFPQSEPL
eukprot:TRINITY_DN1298_c0_g1_i11.p6 TRINITY_DN1298_c0_g1~~TRINITY_DN1298_c0_g1_i11.p6  ORF type:complete len:138 (+),score=27.33 TRINITY_DN1298_c0_g1_i11:613-1026(+)